ncbi:MAG: hypothetical protein HZA34_03135 [Candidatus Pacebacteria bacterium]|nr:hypothetical protein [Candidatus Paceibacterota bacterium]
MKYVITICLALLVSLSPFMVSPAFAQGRGGESSGGGTSGGATEKIRKNIDDAIGINLGGGLTSSNVITFGAILTALLPYLYTASGIILFVMIIVGGFEMLFGATEPKSQESGKQKITSAAIGFILLFVSYWVIQIVQIIFGIQIL